MLLRISADFFFKITFFKKFFKNAFRVSNHLDQDQDPHSDLGPNYLQSLSTDDKVATGKEGVKNAPHNVFVQV